MNSPLKLIMILLFLTGFDVMAQLRYPTPVSYREGFFNFYYKNPDSALFYARRLAEKPEYAPYLREALHSDFYLYFLETTKRSAQEETLKNNHPTLVDQYSKLIATCSNTLLKLYTDTNSRLSQSAEPFYLWTEVRRNSTNLEKISGLTKTFINSTLQRKDFYQNRTATYGLLIYTEIEKEQKLGRLSDELLSALIDRLSAEQMNINVNSSPDSLISRRAWYRYLYDCAHRFKANNLAKAGDVQRATFHFKAAAENGSDLTDLRRTDEYSNENFLFTGRQKNIFHTEYLNYLKIHNAHKDEVLTALANAALVDPSEFKDSLATFYTKNFRQIENFRDFWNKKINANLEKAPTFIINSLTTKRYSSSRRAGKWMLIDFWGTWCGPCREEHPDLQKFYLNSLSDFAGKMEILTVACKDTEEKVSSYMKEFNYSFPVAMADEKIIKLFHISGYPTKVLISPEGNYLVVPFNINWVDFVKKYASL